MSRKTKGEVLSRMRRQYVKAGPKYRQRLIDQAVELLGYHRKSAIRALNASARPQRGTPVILGRPREYDPSQHFGYERYDDPAVVPLINDLCRGALGQLLNHFLPTHKLVGKRREDRRTIRVYGPAQTPYARVMAAPEVSVGSKRQLAKLHATLNPFQLTRDIERQKKQIEARRLLRA